MKKIFVLCIFLSLEFVAISQVSHDLWNNLLKQHVSSEGLVDYKSLIKDSLILNQYLNQLERSYPQASWSDNEVKAFWINAYNAYTVKLITLHYPVKGIKEIGGSIPFVNSTWDIKFIKINGDMKDLNNIEHGILRKKFNDPRIHMALVCASKSCPILRKEAYTGERLNEQLDDQARNFLKNSFRNKITSSNAQISMLFKWYKGDFRKMGGVKSFINKYSVVKITDNTKISHLKYDWNLNE
ncbi:MAG: DUF547 domain-containing protein [Saprospiraceae bacterium]